MTRTSGPCSGYVLSPDRSPVESATTRHGQPRAPQARSMPLNAQLPPHLRELCSLLAMSLLRLRSRTAEELAHDADQVGADGDVSLHFHPEQSGGRPPNRRAA